jgi:hypothetical protein
MKLIHLGVEPIGLVPERGMPALLEHHQPAGQRAATRGLAVVASAWSMWRAWARCSKMCR